MLQRTMSAASSGIRKGFFRCFATYGPSLKYFRVLGIETSCDDTGAAVVDSDRNILGEEKFSQSDVHALHGGILPLFAETLHRNYIKKVVDEALQKSKLTVKDLDAVAVTNTPGMLPNLQIGLEYAKDLCTLFSKPLIPIHHMEAHALTVRLIENVEFPFLVLLISGGHCILALAESVIKFRILAESNDFAPGTVLDKLSRRLKLSNLKDFIGVSGGVAVEKLAKEGNPFGINFYKRTVSKKDCNFIFSGYVTSIMTYINEEEKKLGIEGDQLLPNVNDICAAFQYELTKYICTRVEIGINYLEKLQVFKEKEKTLVVSGGVASNEFIRKTLTHVCESYGFKLLVPPKSLCTDNGVMIAWNGIEKLKIDVPSVPPNKLESVTCIAKSPVGEVESGIKTFARRGRYVKIKDSLQKETPEEESVNSLHKKDAIKNSSHI